MTDAPTHLLIPVTTRRVDGEPVTYLVQVRASTAPGRAGLYDLADAERAVRELLELLKQS